jgi:hypothetical protein
MNDIAGKHALDMSFGKIYFRSLSEVYLVANENQH